MRKFSLLAIVTLIFLGSCTKEENLNGNNVPYTVTQFTLEERITLDIPNDILSAFSFTTACWGLPFNVAYEQMVPAANPNPYAHLVKDIVPSSIKMELLNVEGCDFDMLDNVEVFMVDKTVTDMANIIVFDPLLPLNPYNAVRIASLTSIPDGSGSVLYPNIVAGVNLEEFIHDEDFNIYMNMDIDKTFTSENALIKTTLLLDVTLINDN
ncbi:MAG: hypothetical protein ACI9J3_002710 [Parvicellaceae bacterium]|jgi:hypothetical protein